MTLLTLVPIVAAAVGSGPVGLAKSGCHVQLVPADSSRAWIAAAGALDSELRRAAPLDRDCVQILVRANAENPTVAVLTPDGRQAVRALRGADDLAPTVQGMIITIQPETAGLSDSTTTPDSRPHLLFTAAGGGRVSFPGSLAAAVLDVSGGLTIRRWEMGLFGGWSPGLPMPSAWASPATSQPSFELGAGVGRRIRVRHADLVVGARAGTVRTSPTLSDEFDGMATGMDLIGATKARFLPCVGAFAALALSPTSSVRFRPQFAFQWLPTAASASSAAGAIPGWSLSLSIGAESGAL